MGYDASRFVRRTANYIRMKHPDYSTPCISLSNLDLKLIVNPAKEVQYFVGAVKGLSIAYASNVTTIEGGGVTGDDLILKASMDTYPFIQLKGASSVDIVGHDAIKLHIGAVMAEQHSVTGGGMAIHLKESTTPTAIPDFGAIYTKNDNELYFQTGAGVEKTVTTV